MSKKSNKNGAAIILPSPQGGWVVFESHHPSRREREEARSLIQELQLPAPDLF